MKHDTAGDPMTGVKWTRRTTDKIACELRSLGVNVSSKTVGRLLKQLGFSLRVNHKKLCGATSEDRDTQFACIAELRERFAAAGHPIISVDTKKRELVGLFKNGGQAWNREPTLVKDHDFRSESNGIAIPYGVYDLLANRGTVFIGTSYNTPDFAVNAIEKWWRTEGRRRYPAARDLAILADAPADKGDVLRFLSKKNDVWFPKLKPVPVMGTEKENHTSWERYYRVSDCSSSSRNNWYLWR